MPGAERLARPGGPARLTRRARGEPALRVRAWQWGACLAVPAGPSRSTADSTPGPPRPQLPLASCRREEETQPGSVPRTAAKCQPRTPRHCQPDGPAPAADAVGRGNARAVQPLGAGQALGCPGRAAWPVSGPHPGWRGLAQAPGWGRRGGSGRLWCPFPWESPASPAAAAGTGRALGGLVGLGLQRGAAGLALGTCPQLGVTAARPPGGAREPGPGRQPHPRPQDPVPWSIPCRSGMCPHWPCRPGSGHTRPIKGAARRCPMALSQRGHGQTLLRVEQGVRGAGAGPRPGHPAVPWPPDTAECRQGGRGHAGAGGQVLAAVLHLHLRWPQAPASAVTAVAGSGQMGSGPGRSEPSGLCPPGAQGWHHPRFTARPARLRRPLTRARAQEPGRSPAAGGTDGLWEWAGIRGCPENQPQGPQSPSTHLTPQQPVRPQVHLQFHVGVAPPAPAPPWPSPPPRMPPPHLPGSRAAPRSMPSTIFGLLCPGPGPLTVVTLHSLPFPARCPQ